MKHTKGEWITQGDLDNLRVITEKDGWTNQVCKVIDMDHLTPNYEQNKANAKLIAAAPELLENLTRLLDRIVENKLQDNFPSAFNRAKEAIKKATA